jgi:hypothetical protein
LNQLPKKHQKNNCILHAKNWKKKCSQSGWNYIMSLRVRFWVCFADSNGGGGGGSILCRTPVIFFAQKLDSP